MAEPADQSKKVEQSEVVAECDRFEAELAELRAAWDQYFLGLDRKPPVARHNGLKRHAQQLRALWVRQTAARFRVQSVIQKHAVYERLWSRTLQEIEAGTYKRDHYRSQRQAAAAPPPEPKAAPEAKSPAEPELTPAEADAIMDHARPLGTPLPPALAAARAARAAAREAAQPPPLATMRVNGDAHAIPDSKLRAVYDAYVTARQECNEDVSKLSFDQVAKSLRKQVPELMKKHHAKAVEFKVVIRDGKAVLRAVPKGG